jgi:hypothetical protein
MSETLNESFQGTRPAVSAVPMRPRARGDCAESRPCFAQHCSAVAPPAAWRRQYRGRLVV